MHCQRKVSNKTIMIHPNLSTFPFQDCNLAQDEVCFQDSLPYQPLRPIVREPIVSWLQFMLSLAYLRS